MALLVGGIYFNVLHDSAGAGAMAGIDLGNEKDFAQVLQTITQIIDWAFDAAQNPKAYR